jgi:hypothetical protein
MMRKKIIVAGSLVKECVYSCPAGREDARIRAEKRKISSAAQQRINAKYSWQKLELMLAANFVPGDLVVTLTFDDQHLPETRAAASAMLKKFRTDMSRLRKAAGEQLVMIWTTENKSGSGRWHHHCVINATSGSDFVDILTCWPHGSDIEIRRLEIGGRKSYESLARYFCKEPRERAGLRSWSYTRSCRHPEIETFPVPDDTEVRAPEDATVLEQSSDRTMFGQYAYIKYLAASPQSLRKLRPKTKRRRK